jgi:hypothetical protein
MRYRFKVYFEDGCHCTVFASDEKEAMRKAADAHPTRLVRSAYLIG